MTYSGEEFVCNRELLNQLYAVAAGIRDFAVVGTRLELTQLIVEVKDELLLVNARGFTNFDSATERKGERDSLPFSDAYLEKRFTHAKLSGSSGKRSKSSSECSTGGGAKAARKEAGKKSAASVSGKRTASVKQMLRALALEKRMLPDAALAHVVAAKKQHEAARDEMTELLDEIRDMEYETCDDLPSHICESWIAAHAKQLRSSFDLQCTILRHTLLGLTTSSELAP